jgi:MFS family permease
MSSTTTPAISLLQQYRQLPATVHLLCVGSFINRVGSFVMLFLSIYISEELQLGADFASYCIGAFGCGSVISALIGGQLADQFGRRRTMLLALFGGAATLLLLSQIRTGWLFMLVLFLFAMIVDMYRPASAALIGDAVSDAQRPHAFGLLYLSFNLGFAVAPPLGGYLAGKSFQYLFWADAATTAMYGVVVLLTIRELRSFPPHNTDSRQVAHAGETPVAAADAAANASVTTPASAPVNSAHPRSAGAALQHLLQDQNFLLFMTCSLLTNIVFMQAFVTLPLYLYRLGFNELEFGRMICLNGALIVLLQLPATHLLSRFPRGKVLICGDLLMAAGFSLTALATRTPFILLTITLWTLGEILQAPWKPTLVSEMAPLDLRARYMGLFNITHSLSIALGAPIGGFVLSHCGATVLWPSAGVVLALTSLLYALLFRRLSRQTSHL